MSACMPLVARKQGTCSLLRALGRALQIASFLRIHSANEHKAEADLRYHPQGSRLSCCCRSRSHLAPVTGSASRQALPQGTGSVIVSRHASKQRKVQLATSTVTNVQLCTAWPPKSTLRCDCPAGGSLERSSGPPY